jgi:hypothetical protein
VVFAGLSWGGGCVGVVESVRRSWAISIGATGGVCGNEFEGLKWEVTSVAVFGCQGVS